MLGINNDFNIKVTEQNQKILDLQRIGREREAKLNELLARPPRVIYRDKIRDVPIIETGPCEDVVKGIAEYLAGVLQ